MSEVSPTKVLTIAGLAMIVGASVITTGLLLLDALV